MQFIQTTNKKQTNIWHPCSQMQEYNEYPPLNIAKAYGSYLELDNGVKIIDAISSWWCKSLGHGHPKIKAAVNQQMQKFEHVILANTTNSLIETLSDKLIKLHSNLNKVFYAGDGSCAVEIALKMSLHKRQIHGEVNKTEFIALENGYHGETVAALAVSDLGLYKTAYESILPTVNFIGDIPYGLDNEDFNWDNIEQQLSKIKAKATALILEPLVQGAGGMKIYSKLFLQKLSTWCRENNIDFIVDEIMTGIGRAGKMLAIDYVDIKPDFLCLSKGLTSGWLPFSAVLTTDEIYDAFYADYNSGKSFLHSHTYCGNALGAAAALATLNIMEQEDICHKAQILQQYSLNLMHELNQELNILENIRGLGGLVAAEVKLSDKFRAQNKRFSMEFYKIAASQGVLLRPLGNTIYWMPPLNIELGLVDVIADATKFTLNHLN